MRGQNDAAIRNFAHAITHAGSVVHTININKYLVDLSCIVIPLSLGQLTTKSATC